MVVLDGAKFNIPKLKKSTNLFSSPFKAGQATNYKWSLSDIGGSSGLADLQAC